MQYVGHRVRVGDHRHDRRPFTGHPAVQQQPRVGALRLGRRERALESESASFDELLAYAKHARITRLIQIQAARIVSRPQAKPVDRDIVETREAERLAPVAPVGVVNDGQQEINEHRVTADTRAAICRRRDCHDETRPPKSARRSQTRSRRWRAPCDRVDSAAFRRPRRETAEAPWPVIADRGRRRSVNASRHRQATSREVPAPKNAPVRSRAPTAVAATRPPPTRRNRRLRRENSRARPPRFVMRAASSGQTAGQQAAFGQMRQTTERPPDAHHRRDDHGHCARDRVRPATHGG